MSMIENVPQAKVIDISKKVIGIYGRAGIGKSTLASYFPGVYFAATEAGLSHLDGIFKTNIHDWPSFLQFCKEFVETKHEFKIICIDTYDNLCKICTENKCVELEIDDIGDYKKFGAYHLVTDEINRVLRKLSLSGFGLILISHYKETEMTSKTLKWNRSTVSAGGQNKEIMLNICDPLFYMDSKMKGDQEIGLIKTKPSIYWEAKDKAQLLPEEIEYPLNNTKVAFDIIIKSFSGLK